MSGPVLQKENRLIRKYFSFVIASRETERIICGAVFIITVLIIAFFSLFGGLGVDWGMVGGREG